MQLIQPAVQKSRITSLPRKPAIVGGGELNHSNPAGNSGAPTAPA